MKHYTIDLGDRIVEASPYQDKIFENVESGFGNMIIKAAAGSAKTTTIVKCIEIIDESKKILFVAFNKAIVDTVKKKLNRDNINISTFHSLGLSIFRENCKDFNPDNINEYKYQTYIKSNIEELTTIDIRDLKKRRNLYISNIISLVDYCRYYLAFTEKEITRISNKYGIIPIADEFVVVGKVLKWGKEHIDTIDYTDMIWLPNVLNFQTRRYLYDWILIDEAQDTSIVEQKLIEKCFKRGTRFITCGDEVQQINIWAGSTEEAINNFAKKKNTEIYNLPISYRCPKKVVSLAQRFSENIIAADDAIDGEVNYDVNKNLPKDGDMVLCRITAPLVELHMHYLRINKKSYLKGYENIIEKYLAEIMRYDSILVDFNCCTEDGLFPCMYKNLLNSIENVKKTYNLDDKDAISHISIINLYDTIEGIKVLSEGCTFVNDLVSKIKTVFAVNNENGVQLTTVHKAKGLECDNVFILNPSLMPFFIANKEWEVKTEQNLIYVAYTRAKKTLNFISEDRENRFNKQKLFNGDKMDNMITTLRARFGNDTKKNPLGINNLSILSEIVKNTGLTRQSEHKKAKKGGLKFIDF